jgi:hypothetical protein
MGLITHFAKVPEVTMRFEPNLFAQSMEKYKILVGHAEW